MEGERFEKTGRDSRRVPENYSGTWDDRSDPDIVHCRDKYDNDFIWDGETMDDEKK